MKFVAAISLILAGLTVAVATPTKSPPPPRPPAAKDPSLTPVSDVAGLPRVLLIGDSISMGYTVPVRKLLQGKANIHRIMENGGPTTNGLAKLNLWLGDSKWDVIHFNFGLHDLKLITAGQRRLTVPEYEKNLENIVTRLKATGAKLVWATTTPVPGPASKLARITEDVPLYNAAAQRVMQKNHIPIDDLYAFALPRLAEIQRPENVHYTDAGYDALAKQVAASIAAELPGQRR
jgi:lysophospholipase L1-like esterase